MLTTAGAHSITPRSAVAFLEIFKSQKYWTIATTGRYEKSALCCRNNHQNFKVSTITNMKNSMHDFAALSLSSSIFHRFACHKSRSRFVFVILDNKIHSWSMKWGSFRKCYGFFQHAWNAEPVYAFITAHLFISTALHCSTSEKLARPERNGKIPSYACICMCVWRDTHMEPFSRITHNRRYGDSLNYNALPFHTNFERFIHWINHLMKVNGISGLFFPL